jgi:hypothetical protein
MNYFFISRYLKFYFLVPFFTYLTLSCQQFEMPSKSAAKQIKSFVFKSHNINSAIDSIQRKVLATFPLGTDVSNLSPTISISDKATISPSSESAQDFTKPVIYTVTAEDGTTQTFTVVTTVIRSSAKQVNSFVFKNPSVNALVDLSQKTISATFPAGTDLSKLSPTIIVSDKATVSPKSESIQDFTKPIIYTVTAEDGTIQNFTATMKVENIVSNSADIYIAGHEQEGVKTVAKVWKNGVPTKLSDLEISEARSVFVSGNDVYVAGWENPNDGKSFDQAKLWKNGNSVSLSSAVTGYGQSRAYSVFVSDNNVYVGGTYDPNGKTKYRGVFWKNGVPSYPPNCDIVSSMFVSKGEVYASGKEHIYSSYWTNGIQTRLGTFNGTVDQLYSIFVSNGDVYVAGDEYNGKFWVAKVWKNGVAKNLTDGTSQALVRSIYVKDTDVYVTGAVYRDGLWVATVWKNGLATSLSDGINGHGYANSVFVLGNDVYVVGESPNSKAIFVIKLWKNGVSKDITTGLNNAFATSVFVK